MKKKNQYDCIVVGVGGMGSATCYQIAKRGYKVLGLEQFSPDEHFIIDTHPEFPQVSFAAGFSGHGYKFASVIGEIMADLAIHRQTNLPISLFELGRFNQNV